MAAHTDSVGAAEAAPPYRRDAARDQAADRATIEFCDHVTSDGTPAQPPTADAPAAPRDGMPVWLVGAVTAVTLVVGGLGIGLGLRWISGRGGEPSCDGRVEIGYAPKLAETAAAEPYFQAIDARCQFWLGIDDAGNPVAYKTSLRGKDCVRWDLEVDVWRCGEEQVAVETLEEWPSSVEDLEDRPRTFVVDFGPPPTSTTNVTATNPDRARDA